MRANAHNVLRIVHEQGNVSLESRCAGVTQGCSGGSAEILNVNSKDMPSVEAAVTAKLQQDPSIDHSVAIDAGIALTVVQTKADTTSKPPPISHHRSHFRY
ncbi:hypothetical protein CH254_23960 [Rhodococcus sp. 06-412-2C]|nr:hypothetical protein CH254_23960 [Rhodococcus sp. 06-412-2C]OZC94132.1 hypothetical protein CH279_22045 [Rhodococcus sp. 06-412-2B]